MARIEGQKLKILVLADILARETDSAHGLTVPQLIEALAARGHVGTLTHAVALLARGLSGVTAAT